MAFRFPFRGAAGALPGVAAGLLAVACALFSLSPLAAAERSAPARAAHPVFTVAVLGDGFAEALSEGLRANFATQPDTAIVEATHAPFGLSEPSRLDWPKVVRMLLAGPHLDAAVIMIGSGDMVPLADGAETAAPHGEHWDRLYGDRVQAIADLFRARGVPLIWVGLPIVQDETASADYVEQNAIARDRATAAGATYIDVWNGFADEGGRYSAFGPDAHGKMTRLRGADGIDLTRAGSVKLASFVDADLRAKRAAAPAPSLSDDALVLPSEPGFDAALDIDVSAQIRREAGLTAPSTGKAAGPVIALTAPALSPGGHLVQPVAEPAPLIGTGATLAQRVLVEGEPMSPKPGRVDDFAWPRP